MDPFICEGLVVRWEPNLRIVRVSFGPGARPTSLAAVGLMQQLDAWTGEEPYGIIADLSDATPGTPEFRSLLMAYFRDRKWRVRLAYHNVSPYLLATVHVFGLFSGLQMERVETEDAALRWLRSQVLVVSTP